MELKKFSRDELTDFLINGIPMPETSLTNENTVQFYFEELISFINLAENEYEARTENKLEIVIAFGEKDYIIIRIVYNKLMLYMPSDVAEDINDMTIQEAENVIGLVYGIIVYNERWKEISDLAKKYLKEPEPNLFEKSEGKPIKVNSIEMDNLKEFIKRNKKYK